MERIEEHEQNLEFGGDVEPVIEEVSEPVEQEASSENEKKVNDESLAADGSDDGRRAFIQLRREKYQALAALQQAQEENNRLRQVADDYNYASAKHYEDSIILKFEQAKELKKKALEEGDVEAQTVADVALTAATNDLQNLNSWKIQQNTQAEHQKRFIEEEAQRLATRNALEAQRWIEENDWYDSSSPNYHEGWARVADDYAKQLDAHLYRTGQQHLIHSPDYFHELNNQLRNAYQYTQAQARRDLNMKSSRSNVAPVRNGIGGTEKQTYKLSSDERDLARRLGVTDQVYLQHKIKDMQENPNKRRGRMG